VHGIYYNAWGKGAHGYSFYLLKAVDTGYLKIYYDYVYFLGFYMLQCLLSFRSFVNTYVGDCRC